MSNNVVLLNEDNFEDVYDADSGYYWHWDTTDNRNKFNDMRESSLIAQKFAEFSIAGLIINRIASIIDVLYLEKQKSNVDAWIIKNLLLLLFLSIYIRV